MVSFQAIEKKAKQMACETHIVCKHFLVAIEAKKYGLFVSPVCICDAGGSWIASLVPFYITLSRLRCPSNVT